MASPRACAPAAPARGPARGGAPSVLGTDDEGREVVQWEDGNAGVEPVSAEVASDHALVAVAKLIRRFHDATTTFHWDAGGWNPLLAYPTGSAEIICHNDLSSYHIIYHGADPVALIDWEFAGPSSRLWDLAYACVWLVLLHAPEYCLSAGWGIVDSPRRLRLFCESYGLDTERGMSCSTSWRRGRREPRATARMGITGSARSHRRRAAIGCRWRAHRPPSSALRRRARLIRLSTVLVPTS